MTDSILLIPAPEHREALLGNSPGGGRAPAVSIRKPAGALVLPVHEPWLRDDFALVLRWRGVDDPMGCDRAARALSIVDREPAVFLRPDGDYGERVGGGDRMVLSLARACEAASLGRIVHLDADGREVASG